MINPVIYYLKDKNTTAYYIIGHPFTNTKIVIHSETTSNNASNHYHFTIYEYVQFFT